MKKIISILLILVMSLAILLCSCSDETTDTNTDTSKDTGSQTTDTSADTNKDTSSSTDTDKKPSDTGNDKPGNTDSGTDYDTPIEHNLKVDNSVKLDIFDSENTFGNEGNTVDYTNATYVDVSQLANNKIYTITKGGVYRIHGKSENGQILVNLNDAVNREVVLVLDNLELSYKGTKSVIYIEKCDKATIVLPDNTVSTLTDTSNNLEKGVIHVRSSNLVLDGKGTLNINATSSKSRGIFNTKSLTIEGGVYNITSASSHGIQGEEGVTINGGVFNITSTKSGIKSGDYDEKKPLEAVKGTITVNGGSININAATNGFNAYGSIVINNGRMDVVCKSNGFDANDSVSFTGGIVVVNSDKDGIKCEDVSKTTVEANVVNILQEANIKILAGNDGIDAYSANITTSGVVYIKSNVDNKAFVVDPAGSYIIKNHKFTLVDTTKYPNETFYSLNSCNGIKVKGNLVVENAILGIDSYEDAIDSVDVEIKSGRVVLASEDDGIDVKGNVTINGTLEVMNSNKGIKTPNVTIDEDGIVTVVSTSDALDSPLVVVNGGTLFLLEKLDLTDGKLIVNGGTVIAVSSTKSAVTAETYLNDLSISNYPITTNAKYGNWIRVTDGEKSIVLRLPKSFESKLSLTCISEDIGSGSYSIQIGTYQVGEKINNFVYIDGEFAVIDSFDLTIQ